MNKFYSLLAVCGLLMWSGWAQADTIVKPNTFTAGTPASADEVNANFDTVYIQVNKVGTEVNVDTVNQRVGIGTATPAEKLDVAGKIKGQELQVTNGVVAGHVLTSDAAGNATWQPTAPDADNDPTNESNLSFSLSGTQLEIGDIKGILGVDLAEKLSIGNLSDGRYDGSSLFIGTGAGALDDGGNDNVGVGKTALGNNTSGINNTAIGADALLSATTGTNNVFVGRSAGYGTQTGSFNTVVGSFAGFGVAGPNQSGNVFLGFQAGYLESGSNKLYIDNSNTSNPLIYGDFATDALTVNGTLLTTSHLQTNGNFTAVGNSNVGGNSNVAGAMDISGNVAIGNGVSVSPTTTLNVLGDTNDSITGYFVNNDTVGPAIGLSARVTGVTNRISTELHTGFHASVSGGYTNTGFTAEEYDTSAVNNYGVRGYAANGQNAYGIYGYAAYATNNYAGYFDGNVNVNGNLAIPYQGALTITNTAYSATTILRTGWSGATGVGDYLDLYTPGNGQADVPRMRLTEEGRVGIGTLTPMGTLDVYGSIYQRGASLHADYVFKPEYQLESIEDHATSMWSNQHLPAVPKAEYDEGGMEILEVGAHRQGMLEELEKAHVYIEQLNDTINDQGSQIAALKLLVCQDHPEAVICK